MTNCKKFLEKKREKWLYLKKDVYLCRDFEIETHNFLYHFCFWAFICFCNTPNVKIRLKAFFVFIVFHNNKMSIFAVP